jgi:hypothetical protein
VTQTMTMTLTMTIHPPMNQTIEPEYLFVFVGNVQGILILLLSAPPGFLRGGHVTHLATSVLFLNQLR